MNKTEAAQFLGIGVRSLERRMAEKKIAFTRQRVKGGETVVFNQSELDYFKQELYQPTHESAVEVRQGSPSNSSGMVTNSQIMSEIGESLLILSEGTQAMLLAIRGLANPAVPLHVKPLLTIGEAQKFSGLSRQYLVAAIKEERLNGEKIGRAWRVKRRDLNRFISKLF
ncbi:MAG TPA: helix-turn-helix domain-containing protein [Nostoc sp.]|uniref:helix-turn-helix domain-containing protein n=1 Tax=Nostoc sp. TaxID=1180 RepID=UPI002D46A45D|nr:helix-turn-helix domain-containing protein [Nostoc sp.]HYX17870.1 helix-turn-helix domain-containing protein [Nostoc sp.]